MYTAKDRVLLDKDGNCVAANDPAGVQVLAGFKGAQIHEKTMKVANVKGFKKFFTGGPVDEEKEDSAPSKRVAAEPEAPHAKAATVKK